MRLYRHNIAIRYSLFVSTAETHIVAITGVALDYTFFGVNIVGVLPLSGSFCALLRLHLLSYVLIVAEHYRIGKTIFSLIRNKNNVNFQDVCANFLYAQYAIKSA